MGVANAKLRTPRPHTRKVDRALARYLRETGLLYREVADILGVSSQAARMACRPDLEAERLKRAYRPMESLTERIARYYEPQADGCWLWTGPRNDGGYGMFSFERQRRRAHRVMYELHVGPIPDGLTLDHLCRNRGCVNPEHLEPVTQAENVRRGFKSRGGRLRLVNAESSL